mgnify:CR=1 FL=1
MVVEMITIEQARESFFEYVNFGVELINKAMAHPDPKDKLILSWAIFFCGGISAKITEAFLLENAGHWHPATRLRTNTKLNELHDLNVRQMQDDGAAWN